MVLRIIVGMTGASGMIYAWRLLEVLKQRKIDTCVIITRPAERILQHELEKSPQDVFNLATEHYSVDDLTSPVASGSQEYNAMAIVPCSMASIGAIACGDARNLLLRAADISLKEGRALIVVPRETPMSTIHLDNLLKLSRLGVIVIPASPGFYHKPRSIEDLVDFVVGRILMRLGLEQDLFEPWKGTVA